MNDPKFPPLKNDRLLKAAWGQPVDCVPVWVMRQAGRYLPAFRELREKFSFFEMCQTPELACEVSLMPLQHFDLDAAIIFSDILVVLQALGLEVQMKPGIGPVIPEPLITPVDIDRLAYPCDVPNKLKYVFEAITLTRLSLYGRVPLIGFAGAPWTLMCYMVEGGGSKTMSKAKTWLYKWPDETHKLLDIITDVVVDLLVGQIQAGAQILQVFESNAEYLSPESFETFSLPYLRNIKRRVNEAASKLNLEKVPMILFAKGSCNVLDAASTAGYEVLSVDWTIRPEEARKKVLSTTVLQGNLDPVALKASPPVIEEMVQKMLNGFGTQKYIANLGHGIYPDMDPDHVSVFVKAVHMFSRQMIAKKAVEQ